MVRRIPTEWRTRYLPLLLILLVGATLRLYDLGGKSLRGDEIATWVRSRDLSWVVDPASRETPSVVEEPVFYMCTSVALLFGQGEGWLRLPVAVAGILSLAALYKVGERLLGPVQGLVGAALLALSPLHLWYSQDARKYAVLILLLLLTLLALEQALRTASLWSWSAFGAGALLCLGTHPMAVLALLAVVLWAGVVLLAQKGSPGLQRQWLSLLLCVLLLGALFLPRQLGILRDKVLVRGGAEGVVDEETASQDQVKWTLGTFAEVFQEFAGGDRAVHCLMLGLAVLALGVLFRQRWEVAMLAALWVGVPMAVLLLLQPQHRPDTRFVSFWLPLYLVLVVHGMVVLVEWAGRVLARAGKKWARVLPRVGLVALVVGVALANRPALAAYYGQEKRDWRGAGAILEENAQPDEVVVVVLDRMIQCLNYYAPDLDGVQEIDSLAEFQVLYENYAGLWFVHYGWARGYERAIGGVLKSEGFATVTLDGDLPIKVSYRRRDASAVESQLRLLEGAAGLYPDRTDLQVALGGAYLAAGRPRVASVAYERALAADPALADSPQFLVLLGQAQYDADELALARRTFEQVLCIDPDNSTALGYLQGLQP